MEDAYTALRAAAEELLRTRERAVLAVDGRCGSGKTTLAARLAADLPVNVLHTDDFYLPFARRVPDWAEIPAANMDLERLAETIAAARTGEPYRYRTYDCARDVLHEGRLLAPARLTVVEGSYSHHPRLAPLYDARLFLTCSAAAQEARLRAREGERFDVFAQRWIPLEEAYFARCGIEGRADAVLRTD